jgi:hypothetical protein
VKEMSSQASKEQILYASILNKGMLIGLASLIIIFIIYCSGVSDPFIPMKKVETYWIVSVHEYLEGSGMQPGWAWFGKLQYSDMLNYLPIAFLSLLTVICYIAIIPGLIRKKDYTYVIISILEIIVLAVAASGILGTSSH